MIGLMYYGCTITNWKCNKTRCSCPAGENGYCNHTMGHQQFQLNWNVTQSVPSCSVLSYQRSLTEGNFNVITNFPALQRPRTVDESFPDLPLAGNDCKCLSLMARIENPEGKITTHDDSKSEDTG